MEASALGAPAGLSRRTGSPKLLRLRTDDQLVALFRLGREDAFQAIHDRYRTRLIAYMRQMLGGSGADAEDAMQDVFIRAYGALRADDRPVTLRAWLYRVAHNRCIDQLRRPAGADVELDEARGLQHDSGRDSFAEAMQREDLRQLVADVRRLPEQQRSALLMREMEGLSYQELADVLKVTVPAVKSLLVRARMGLVEAHEARSIACTEIRADLVDAHARGVRATGRAKRHLRECDACTEYRASLKGLDKSLAALTGGGISPFGMLLKAFGLGGSGAGAGAAATGGGAAAGGTAAVGSTAAVGGSAVAGTAAAAKVAAVVCCAALVGGGAVEAGTHSSAAPKHHAKATAHAARATAGGSAATTSILRVAAHGARMLGQPARAATASSGAAHTAAASHAAHKAVHFTAVAGLVTSRRSSAGQRTSVTNNSGTGAALGPDEGDAASGPTTAANQTASSSQASDPVKTVTETASSVVNQTTDNSGSTSTQQSAPASSSPPPPSSSSSAGDGPTGGAEAP